MNRIHGIARGDPNLRSPPNETAAILPQAVGGQLLRVHNHDTTPYPLPSDQLWHSLKEGSKFFQHEDDIYETLRRLVDELDKNGLDYALIDGLALVAHGYRHRLKDLADVQELIARLKLQPQLAENLDASVRDEYRRLWQNAQSIPPEE